MVKVASALRRMIDIYHDGGNTVLISELSRFMRNRSRDLCWNRLNITRRPTTALRLYVGVGHRINPRRYTDADPVKVVRIDPDAVTRMTDARVFKFGRVHGGDWDVTAPRFMDQLRPRSIAEHFQRGVPWEETGYYEHSRQLIEKRGRDRYGCRSEPELRDRFEGIDELYRRISTDGYRSQRELLEADPVGTNRENNDEPTPVLNEVGVNVGRDGEFLFSLCGLHRLAIARVLDLDEIPVLIRSRHREWQWVRDAVRKDAAIDVDEILLDHPDLADLR